MKNLENLKQKLLAALSSETEESFNLWYNSVLLRERLGSKKVSLIDKFYFGIDVENQIPVEEPMVSLINIECIDNFEKIVVEGNYGYIIADIPISNMLKESKFEDKMEAYNFNRSLFFTKFAA